VVIIIKVIRTSNTIKGMYMQSITNIANTIRIIRVIKIGVILLESRNIIIADMCNSGIVEINEYV